MMAFYGTSGIRDKTAEIGAIVRSAVVTAVVGRPPPSTALVKPKTAPIIGPKIGQNSQKNVQKRLRTVFGAIVGPFWRPTGPGTRFLLIFCRFGVDFWLIFRDCGLFFLSILDKNKFWKSF